MAGWMYGQCSMQPPNLLTCFHDRLLDLAAQSLGVFYAAEPGGPPWHRPDGELEGSSQSLITHLVIPRPEFHQGRRLFAEVRNSFQINRSMISQFTEIFSTAVVWFHNFPFFSFISSSLISGFSEKNTEKVLNGVFLKGKMDALVIISKLNNDKTFGFFTQHG